MFDDLKADLKDALTDAVKRALADKLPMVIGLCALALISAFFAGMYFGKRK